MHTADVVADELLGQLRAAIGTEVVFAEMPSRMGGGFYTANYRFALADAPPAWSRPMVLRLFPTHAPAGLDAWEGAAQAFAHDRGLPAPAITLCNPAQTIAGRRWFVMELLPGAPALAGTRTPQLLRSLPSMVRNLPRQTAEIHLALHRLDPATLIDAFGTAATINRWLDEWERTFGADPTHPLRTGYEWLRANQPEPTSSPVLCHGDTWAGNLLMENGTVTGLIDWTVAVVAEPALDVGFLTAALSLAPGVPRAVQHLANLVGRHLANAYLTEYRARSDAALERIPYYQALRCLLELRSVVAYRTSRAEGLKYDGPRPAWDTVAARAVHYFNRRTGVALDVREAVWTDT